MCPVFCTHTRARTRVRVFLMEHKDPGLDRSFDADRVDRMRSLSRELRNEISFHSVDDSLVLGAAAQGRIGGWIPNCQPGSPAAVHRSP